MIKVINLTKTYKAGGVEFHALKGVSFEINKGESLAIIGRSGSGKSTLMHLLAGLDTPTTGEVIYSDKSIGSMNESELANFRNEEIGFVFQQFFIQPELTVLENVELPLKIKGIPSAQRKEIALKALEEVGLIDKKNNRGTDLSGGQKQRVCIARALVNEPTVIFADEPTGNLDSENGEKIIDLLFNLNKSKNITLVIVTHDSELAEMCNRQLVVKDGEIIKEVTK